MKFKFGIIVLILLGFMSCRKGNDVLDKDSLKPVYGEPITDNEGSSYKTVIIGSQTWMVGNLKTNKFNNGDLIETTTAGKDLRTEIEPKFQWAYDGIESNAHQYGRLYTWNTINDKRGICPSGYHVPTLDEWLTLINYLGGGSKAIHEMIDLSTWPGSKNWLSYDENNVNGSGFSATASGERFNMGFFWGKGLESIWWTSTLGESSPYCLRLSMLYYYDTNNLIHYESYESNGYAVRCIKDK